MTPQQECDQFKAKVAKATKELQEDFNKLSPEAQFYVQREANAFLRMYGCAITAQDLAQRFFG